MRAAGFRDNVDGVGRAPDVDLPRTLAMKIIAAAVLLLMSAPAERVVADTARPRGERETRFERKEIDAAISAAETSAGDLLRAVDEALDETKQDRRKREAMIRESLDELVAALARLREKFDEDGAWTD